MKNSTRMRRGCTKPLEINLDNVRKNITTICRLCLNIKNAKLYNIFNENLKIHNKITSHCKLKMYQGDGLPEFICSGCLNDLEKTAIFIQRCEDSDTTLRNLNIQDIEDIESVEMSVKEESCSESDQDSYKPSDHSSFGDSDSESENDEKPDIFSCINSDPLEINNTVSKVENPLKEKFKIENHIEKNDKKRTVLTYTGDFVSRKMSKEKGSEKRLPIVKCPENLAELCPVCGKCFPNYNAFHCHMDTHKAECHPCPECQKVFTTKALLRNHRKIHVRTKAYPCEICGKTFATPMTSKMHTENVHYSLNAVTCDLCNRKVKDKKSLVVHMKTVHSDIKDFSCDFCDKKFAVKLRLIQHRRIHTGEKPFECKYCDAKFSASKTAKEHERTHTGERPYVCSLCPKACLQLSNLKSHFKSIHKGVKFPKITLRKSN